MTAPHVKNLQHRGGPNGDLHQHQLEQQIFKNGLLATIAEGASHPCTDSLFVDHRKIDGRPRS